MKYNRKIALCMLGLITVIGICGNTGHNVQASEEMVDEEVTVFDDEEEQIELEIPESEQNDFETDVIEDDEVEYLCPEISVSVRPHAVFLQEKHFPCP